MFVIGLLGSFSKSFHFSGLKHCLAWSLYATLLSTHYPFLRRSWFGIFVKAWLVSLYALFRSGFIVLTWSLLFAPLSALFIGCLRFIVSYFVELRVALEPYSWPATIISLHCLVYQRQSLANSSSEWRGLERSCCLFYYSLLVQFSMLIHDLVW